MEAAKDTRHTAITYRKNGAILFREMNSKSGRSTITFKVNKKGHASLHGL